MAVKEAVVVTCKIMGLESYSDECEVILATYSTELRSLGNMSTELSSKHMRIST